MPIRYEIEKVREEIARLQEELRMLEIAASDEETEDEENDPSTVYGLCE